MKPYHRTDNKIHEHEKFLEAGITAAGMWMMCRSYCADNWTDGFIPRFVARRYVPKGMRLPQLAAKLVDVGLWDEVDGGWQMHDYADWNTTVAERDEANAAAAERMRQARSRDAGATQVRRKRDASATQARCKPPEPAGQTEMFARTDEQEVRTRSRTRGTTSLVARGVADGIVDRWREHYDGRPTDATKDRLKREINKLLRQGYPPIDVERAVVEWHKLNLHPATLQSVFDQLQRGTQKSRPIATADARSLNTLELGASLIARGIE